MFENTRSTTEEVDFLLFNAKIPHEQQMSSARSFLKQPADDPYIKEIWWHQCPHSIFKKNHLWQNKVRRLCDPRLALSMCTYTPTELTRKPNNSRNLKQWFSPFISHTNYFCVHLGINKWFFSRYWKVPSLTAQKYVFIWKPSIRNPTVNNSKLNWSVGDTKKQQLAGVKTNEGNATVCSQTGGTNTWRATQTNHLHLRLKMIICFI